MRRFAPSHRVLGVLALVAAGAASCSSDEVRRASGDGGDASPSGGSAGTSGTSGTSSSTGGSTGGSSSGGRGDGGSATGARSGSGGRAGASGSPTSGGKGGKPAGAGGGTTESDAGDSCTDTAPAVLCVRGSTTASTGETVAAGDKLIVDVRPRGCFSSSCTETRVATCSISGTAPFAVDAHFCLASTAGAGSACTADCSGGGVAHCEAGALTAGQHTVQLGTLSVAFNVPALLPFGGECIGSAF